MPRKKKEPKDMTTEELARRIFPPKVLQELKRIAHEGEQEEEAERQADSQTKDSR